MRSAIGLHFGSHQPLGPGPKRTSTVWPGRSSVMPIAAQGLHVDENIRSSVAAGEEAEPAQTIEPLDLARSRPEVGVTVTCVRGGGNCAGWIAVLSSMERMRKACMPFGRCSASQTTRAPFIGGLEAVAPQAGHVQQHIGGTIIGDDEAEALRHIEPFDRAGYFNQVGGGLIRHPCVTIWPQIVSCTGQLWPHLARRHDHRAAASLSALFRTLKTNLLHAD